jgi:hypothetical protein
MILQRISFMVMIMALNQFLRFNIPLMTEQLSDVSVNQQALITAWRLNMVVAGFISFSKYGECFSTLRRVPNFDHFNDVDLGDADSLPQALLLIHGLTIHWLTGPSVQIPAHRTV